MRKKIIHFIFNLGRGGAETMMVRVIKELPEYDHVVVTLFPMNHFGNELQCSKFICLDLASLFSLPFGIAKFRRIIKQEKPDIVHTHLFWPTVIARFSVPRHIPLITTIHAFISTSVEYKQWHVRFLDKLSYKFRESIILVVAKGAMKEYFSFLGKQPYKAHTLYTFVDIERFNKQKNFDQKQGIFKLVSVGALRRQKNYMYLVNAMALLKGKDIELDIYGVGDMQNELQQQIDATGAKVILKGEVNNIQDIVPQYNLYVMSSTYEGFSLSVLEAMAMGMPLLLSDNPSFKEQCEENAWYFSLSDIKDLTGKIDLLSSLDKNTMREKGEAGRKRAVDNFTLTKHIQELRNIYNAALIKNN